jgi:hypothetical protein
MLTDGVKALVKLLQIRLVSRARLFGDDGYDRERLAELAAAPHLTVLPGERQVEAQSGNMLPARPLVSTTPPD